MTENLLQGGKGSPRHSARDGTWQCLDGRVPEIASPASMMNSSDGQDHSMRLRMTSCGILLIEGKRI